MNRAAPWNIRGVGLDTREAAREAARRAGMSLGEWLDSVIAEEASVLGVEAEDIDADDRLEAVTAKLSKLTGAPANPRKATREAPPRLRPHAARPAREPAYPDMYGNDDDEAADTYAYGDAGPVIGRRAATPVIDPEAMLDAAVARMELKTSTAQRQTNAALENVAARLADIETGMTARRDDTAIAPIKTALGRLEERLENLSRRPAPPRADPRVEASLRDLTERLDEVAHKIDRSAAPKPRPEDSAHIQRLDAKLSSLISHLSESETRRANVAALEDRARRTETEQRARLAEAEERNRKAEAEHRQRAAEAEKRVRQAEAEMRAKAAEADERVKAAEAEQRALAARRPAQPLRGIAHVPFAEAVSDIERRQRDLDRAPTRGRADPAFDNRLELIANRIEKVADAATGAGRSSDAAFSNLHGEIGRLAKRLDDMRSDAQRAPEVHPEVVQLKQDIAGMARALADLAPRGSVAALETAVRDLATRIEISRQDGARENLLAPVEALVADLQATLKDYDPRSSVVELDREIKNIGRKVETMTITGFDPEAFKRIHSQSQEIRDLLTAAVARPLPVEKIERQIASLGARIEHLAQAQIRTPQPDVTSAIGEIRTMFDRAMVERAAPNQNIAVLEKRLETLALKIDQAVARPAPAAAVILPDTSGLERMMTRFTERMEATRQAGHDPGLLETLQKQIAHISAKLDTSDANLKSLGGIENSIADLFDGLERTQAAAVSAAAVAAEKAAHASLQQAIKNLPQPAQHNPAEAQAIKRDLLDIRAEQDATGKRSHAALNAVHVTLEKVVDRLAAMESRHASVNPAQTLEEARRLAAEAARAAARDTVREALQNLPAPVANPVDTLAFERGIVALRAEQDAAGKRAHATLSAVHGTLEKVVDRLAMLEDTLPQAGLAKLEETRELAMEAARAAARETMRDAMADMPTAADRLDAELIKSDMAELRFMHEEAGERTHSTLKAVHTTLERVVDRLATLEVANAERPIISTSAPPIMRERPFEAEPRETAKGALDSAPVFVPAPRRFDIAIDPQTLRPRTATRPPELAPTAPVAPIAPAATKADASVPTLEGPDMLLEPGSGFPPHRGAGPGLQSKAQSASAAAGGEAGAPASPATFIAAARRAAQAAAAENGGNKQAATGRVAAPDREMAGAVADGAAASAKLAMARSFVSVRKKPILIGLTGLVVVLGATMLARAFLHVPAPMQKVEIPPAETSAALTPAEPAAPTRAPPTAAPAAVSLPSVTLSNDPLSLQPAVKSPLSALTPGSGAPAIAGDVASRSLAKGKQQVAAAVPAPESEAAGAIPHMLATPPVKTARTTDIDTATVGSIDGKSGTVSDPALAPLSVSLREAALGGSAAAQYEVGLRYAEGRSVARDLKTAARWLEKSAGQGLAPAQYRIGSLYEKGLGVTRDIGQAKSWYIRAAEGGNIRAMHNLAVLTAEGAGSGKPDYAAAAQWFKRAAEFGVRDSQYNLAILYARGLGLEQSLTQSYTWFSIAANQGDEDAAKKRDEVAGKLDAKTLAEAKSAVEAYRAAPSAAASNEVPPPAGGWDAGAPAKPEGGKSANKV